MHHLELDFIKPVPRYNHTVMVFLLLIIIIVTACFVYQQQLWDHEIDLKIKHNLSKPNKVTLKFNPVLQHQFDVALKIEQTLNIHWEQMLNGLEQSQILNSDIKLISILPNPDKSQILISGETAEFDTLIKYIDSLRQEQNLGDVVLLNQHWEQNNSTQVVAGNNKLVFNVLVYWIL